MFYAQAFVTPSQNVKVMAHTLWDKFVMSFGLLEKILNDQHHNLKGSKQSNTQMLFSSMSQSCILTLVDKKQMVSVRGVTLL